jgi:uncharacterized protein YdeI (YjbR/CyaY-like superfamily)
MSRPAIKTFTAVLEPLRNSLGWVIARVPFDPIKAWPKRRGLRVHGEIISANNKTGGYAFRTSLFAASDGQGHFLLVNKKMQAGAKASVGERVRIRMEPDLEERAVETPPELTRALKGDRRLPKWFAKLSDSMRREIGAWVNEPKGAVTRRKRAEGMAERLLLTLEGEIEAPPILQAAFQRQPLARKGWEAMTPTQRRRHLLGIFGYQSADSRERRTAKAVEMALCVARKRTAK